MEFQSQRETWEILNNFTNIKKWYSGLIVVLKTLIQYDIFLKVYNNVPKDTQSQVLLFDMYLKDITKLHFLDIYVFCLIYSPDLFTYKRLNIKQFKVIYLYSYFGKHDELCREMLKDKSTILGTDFLVLNRKLCHR